MITPFDRNLMESISKQFKKDVLTRKKLVKEETYVALGKKGDYYTVVSKPASKQEIDKFSKDLELPRGEELVIMKTSDAKKLKKVVGKEYLKEDEAKGGEKAGKMELHTTPVEDAKKYAEEKGIDLEKDIPNFEENYTKAQKMANLGKTKRKDMPVINDTQVKQFQERLKKGYIDINEPFSKTYDKENPFPTGLSGLEADDFLDRGLKDKAKKDDVVSVTIKQLPVGKLKPIQKQIYADKSLDASSKFGVDTTKKFLSSKTFFIASDDNFIIDGHHRYLSGMLIDPDMKVNVLSIDLPIKDLLPLSTAYGDAIGNKRNA